MKLPRITGSKVVKALKKGGFEEARVHGSHHILYSREKNAIVTIPVHTGKSLAPKTLKSILDGARLSIDEFRELLES